jgi:hypothetical protein
VNWGPHFVGKGETRETHEAIRIAGCKAEIWVEDGTLKVRGYIGFFYKTQTWVKSA